MSRERESLDIYGNLFQTRIIQASLKDFKFFSNIYEILKPEYFGNEIHKSLWKAIQQFYQKYKACPSVESLKVEFATEEDDTKELVHRILWEIDHKIDIFEIEQAKEKAFKFCSNRSMESAISDSVDLLRQNKFDEIQIRIEKALKETSKIDLGHEYFTSFHLRKFADLRKTVSTGFSVLDDKFVLDGGLASGELGVIVAPSGKGKSFFLVNIGVGAIRSNVDVVHYTFELSDKNIGVRYDSCITGVETKSIRDRYEEVEKILGEFKGGRLIIKEFPTRTATVNNIRFHFEHLRACGYNPGVIIVDYADLMNSRKGYGERRFELESIYEDLRGLSMDIQVPVWTASQCNRCIALDSQVITPDGPCALEKIEQGDVILTHKGYRKVTKVFPIERAPSYRITTESKKEIVCSINHKFSSFCKRKDNAYGYFSIQDGLQQDDYLEVRGDRGLFEKINLITDIGERQLKDIEVEDTHLFYANDIYVHNSGFGGDIITLDKMGESIAKAQISDFIATFSSNLAEERRGLGKLFIAKNRIGAGGYWLPVATNFAKAQITVSKRIEDEDFLEDSEDSTSSIIKKLFEEKRNKKGF